MLKKPMATSSFIGVQKPNGSIEAIYCYANGYPSGLGLTLQTYHNSEEAANQIIALGDLSYLAEKLAPEEGQVHSFNSLVQGVTLAYHRDRGEPFIQPKKYDSVEHFLNKSNISAVNYLYLFRDSAWFFTPVYGAGKGTWKPCVSIQ
jgi:hypothetical protein